MKYYSDKLHFTLSSDSSNTSESAQKFSEIKSLIKKNFNLKEIAPLSKELHNLSLKLKNFIFYTYTIDIFEDLYPTRFALSSDDFCQLQEFIFSYINQKGTSELVYHLDSSYENIFEICPKENITDNYKKSVEKYYLLAKSSESSDFSNHDIFIEAVQLPEYAIFHSYSTGMKPFHDFVKFAKHSIIFNYFKYFLHHPNMPQNTIQSLVSLSEFLPLSDNPRLNEFDLFIKFMEKEHWTQLLAFKNEPRFQIFLEQICFFKNPRKNSSSSIFRMPNQEHVHLVNYSNLETINKKNIDLNVFFDEITPYPDFTTFVFKTIEKRLDGKELTLDQEGHDYLLTLLKTQSYFRLLNKYPEKGLSSKTTKI